jgi:hypothetical protein
MNFICPNAEKCPIFNGILKGKEYSTKAYKTQYCENPDKREECRRWQCKQKFGKVPDNLLPNSGKSIEEIGRENNWGL